MIIMFIGPSGSGKDTFFYPTLKEYALNPIILSTTRPMRKGEVDKKTYYFITMDQMNLLERQKKLVERRNYQTVNGLWSYATNSDQIDLASNYLTLNTWEAYQKFVQFYGSDQIVPLYFHVDDGIRLQRSLERERSQKAPNYKELCRRYLADTKDFDESYLTRYNPYIIDNDGSIEKTQKEINSVLKKVLKK